MKLFTLFIQDNISLEITRSNLFKMMKLKNEIYYTAFPVNELSPISMLTQFSRLSLYYMDNELTGLVDFFIT